MKDLDIAVVGAGIGGLTTTLALQRAGFRVRLYEQAPALAEVGAGLTITPNGTRVLDHLGLADGLRRVASAPGRRAIKHYATGEVLVDLPPMDMVARFGAQYWQVHRADLHGLLAEAVLANDPGCIALNHTAAGFNEVGGRVTLRFRSGSGVQAGLVIGADGVKSVVRNSLFRPESPRFTGFVAWRGLVPMERLRPGIVDPQSAVSVGPGHMFTRYTIRSGRTLNYVAFARRDSWTDEGWAVPSAVGELADEFREFEPDVREMLAATPPEFCFKWGLFNRPPLASWGRGHVVLLGDAAHPFTPFRGQGAVMAIEDGMVLARALVASASVGEALERYQHARIGRANGIMAGSLKRADVLLAERPEQQVAMLQQTEEAIGLFDYDAVNAPI